MADMMMDDDFGTSMNGDDSIGNSTETMMDGPLPTKIGDAIAEVREQPILGGGQAELVTTPAPTTAPVPEPSEPPRTPTAAPLAPTDPPVTPPPPVPSPVASPVAEPTVAPVPVTPPTKPPRKPSTPPITSPPTEAPTVHYDPVDDDPITDKDFEIVEEVENQLAKQEKVARTAGGFGFVLAICAMIFTAHQMSENPDGIFARYVNHLLYLFFMHNTPNDIVPQRFVFWIPLLSLVTISLVQRFGLATASVDWRLR